MFVSQKSILFICVCAACKPVETPVLDGIPPAWTQDTAVLGPDWATSAAPLDNVPKLGTIDLVLNDAPAQWQTVDLSVGAIDPTASFERLNGTPTLRLTGFAPDDTLLEGRGLISVTATFDDLSGGDAITTDVFLAGSFAEDVVARGDDDLQVTVTQVIRNVENSYGAVAGTITGTLCRVQNDPSGCQSINGAFSSKAWVPE
jgi:hypothetical protein